MTVNSSLDWLEITVKPGALTGAYIIVRETISPFRIVAGHYSSTAVKELILELELADVISVEVTITEPKLTFPDLENGTIFQFGEGEVNDLKYIKLDDTHMWSIWSNSPNTARDHDFTRQVHIVRNQKEDR